MSDFDKLTIRRETSSVKWDSIPEGFTQSDMEDVIPMWVADMDFEAPQCVLDALQSKLEQKVFGYTQIPDDFYQSIITWFGNRHHWQFKANDIIPIDGLVPGASIALKAITNSGDEIITQTPAYNCFFSSIRNIGCVLSENKLLYKNGCYSIDYTDLEHRCKTAKALLFCNPHNPSGRLWTREELTKVSEICLRNNVTIVSDEIHCDIVPPFSEYIPMASLSNAVAQHCISLVSPTKCFNLAGLMVSSIITINPDFKKQIDKVINTWEHCDLGQFGVAALPAAFSSEGEKWLNEMNQYVHANYLFLKQRIESELPMITICPLESTYLVWMDCSKLHTDTLTIKNYLIRHQKVWINDGAMYGDKKFMRINIACPRQRLSEAINRIINGLQEIISQNKSKNIE